MNEILTAKQEIS